MPPSNNIAPWNATIGVSWTALNESEVPDAVHPDAQTAAYITGLLKGAAASGRPFFLAPGFYKPHLPWIFPSRFLSLYSNMTTLAQDFSPPQPPMANASWTAWAELSTYLDVAATILENNLEFEILAPSNAMPPAKALELRKAYFAATSFNDAMVGQVLDALAATGLDKNTTVVLFGDHGWQLGDHGDWAKHENFEDTTRAPLIIRAPAYPQSAGRIVTGAFTQLIDLYPTLLELAGLPADPGLQGVSLVPLLANPNLPQVRSPNAAYSQYATSVSICPGTFCWLAHGMGYSVRTPDARFTSWVQYDNNTYTTNWQPVAGQAVTTELYNHTGDVGYNWFLFENANLAYVAGNEGLVANLSAVLRGGPNLLPSV